MLRDAGRHDALRRRARMHHRRGRRLDRPAARHRRAGRTAARSAPPTATRRSRSAARPARGPNAGPGATPATRCCAGAGELEMRVLYLNPFSQEVSGPDESLRTLLGALIPSGRRGARRAPGARAAGRRGTRRWARRFTSRRSRSSGGDLSLADGALSRRGSRGGRDHVARLARRVGADLIHTNMEVLLEGGLAARLLGLPHVLHYRGNTLDRPKLVFDGLARAWTPTADHVYCISHATAGVFERRGRGAQGRGSLQPRRSRARSRPPSGPPTCARLWAPGRTNG